MKHMPPPLRTSRSKNALLVRGGGPVRRILSMASSASFGGIPRASFLARPDEPFASVPSAKRRAQRVELPLAGLCAPAADLLCSARQRLRCVDYAALTPALF